MAFSQENVAGQGGLPPSMGARPSAWRMAAATTLAGVTVLIASLFAVGAAKAEPTRHIDVIVEVSTEAAAFEAFGAIKDAIDSQTEVSLLPGLRMVTASVSPTELDKLRDLDVVTHVEVDTFLAPALAESGAIIGAPAAWAVGETGRGTAVAVIDTGVDATHPFLRDRVTLEACFSLASCPGGRSRAFGAGSATPCKTSDCTHGTHVAGIIAGESATTRGIAPEAQIIAIQVFSMIQNERECGSPSPCARARTSDVLAALDYLHQLRNDIPLTAVNLSLSSDDAVASCDEISLAAAIVRLREAGIASIAAAGNGGSRAGLGIPACISSTISVGATDISGERFWTLSNSSPELDFWAPGVSVVSSVPGGGFAAASGTSAAAPHVAGAWTLAAARIGTNDVDEIHDHLRFIGAPIDDSSRAGNTAVRVSAAALVNSPAAVVAGAEPVIADFNGDRRDDILWHSPAGGEADLWFGSSSSNETFAGGSATTPRARPTIADFNGDGRDDVFWDGPDRTNYLWFGQSDGTFEVRSSSTSQLFTTFIGDFNGDGNSDIYWNAKGTADWVWFGRTDRRFDAVRASAGDDFEPFIGDFDGDGRDDIFFNRAGPSDWLWYGRSDRRFDARRASAGGSHTPIVSDYDGNGTDDILWDSTGTNNWIWYTARNRINRPVAVRTSADGVATVGDFDADGRADIVWDFPGTSDEVWHGTAEQRFSSARIAVDDGRAATAGDFNGDNHTDIIWTSSTTKTLWFGQSHRKFLEKQPRIV